MQPTNFEKLVEKFGKTEKYKVGHVFHSQDFPDKLFLLKSGYVKRYQATNPNQKVIELIYGPRHIISLSQLYKMLFEVDQNEESMIYIYQAMTDIEINSIDADIVFKKLENNPEFYKDFFYESGLRLRSNIFRLTSNALKDDYKKVAHQIVCLYHEFGERSQIDGKPAAKILVPLESVDMAEQLNISTEVAEAMIDSLINHNLIYIKDNFIYVMDIDRLKDVYL